MLRVVHLSDQENQSIVQLLVRNGAGGGFVRKCWPWRRIHGDNHSLCARPPAHAEHFRFIRLMRRRQRDNV